MTVCILRRHCVGVLDALPVVDWRTLPGTFPAAEARATHDVSEGARA